MPNLQSMAATASKNKIFDAIKKDGAVIINDLMSKVLADRVYAETIEYVNSTPPGDASFSGSLTTRTGALVARSPACNELVANRTALKIAKGFLDPYCDRVQLHLTQMIRIKPGQPKQQLHRDREAWGRYLPKNVEPQLNMIWALTDFTKENGATQVVPGSHKWASERHAKQAEITYAEMPRGSVLIFTGSVIHGGGANNSQMERFGINIDYSLAWLRQEENQYLSCPPEVAKHKSAEIQELLGYTMGSIACGYYSQLLPPGQAREVCAPEFALGRKPRLASTGMATMMGLGGGSLFAQLGQYLSGVFKT